MDNKARLKAFLDAENARDWQSYAGYLHPDVMWFIHAEDGHTPVVGREEYVETIKRGYARDDRHFTYGDILVSSSGNRLSVLITSEDGKRSLGVYDLEDGLIRWEHEFSLD